MQRTYYDDEHRAFAELAGDFAVREVARHIGDWETDGIVPREVFAKAGAVGLLGFAAGQLRLAAGRYPTDPTIRDLVSELQASSDEFRRLWELELVETAPHRTAPHQIDTPPRRRTARTVLRLTDDSRPRPTSGIADRRTGQPVRTSPASPIRHRHPIDER
jgi:hypothetical protein